MHRITLSIFAENWTEMIKVNEVLNNYLTKNSSTENDAKIKAAANIKELLNMIDLNVELIPEKNPEMLTRLISTLKGKELSSEEEELVNEITR
jgi:hypothetical protein